jgi:hypothetical protein
MYKANTYYDEEQPYSFANSTENHTDKLPTETEKKALHFFETGISYNQHIFIRFCFYSR